MFNSIKIRNPHHENTEYWRERKDMFNKIICFFIGHKWQFIPLSAYQEKCIVKGLAKNVDRGFICSRCHTKYNY